MTQIIEKVIEEKGFEIDEIIGDMNPRYFEEAMTFEEAHQKVYSAGNVNYNIFRSF